MTDLDRIDRQIDIEASAERVWALVSRPGWYINQGSVVSNPDLETDGDLTVVRHPEHGNFRIRTETLDEPRYAAFRWLGEGDDSTLVEFWITDRDGDGVTLRVVESGFEGLRDPEWLRKREENVEGWESELAAAAAYAGSRAVHRAVDLAAPREAVWPLLTTSEGWTAWYGFGGATVTAEPGAALTFSWAEHRTYRGRVTTVDEPEAFAFRLAATPGAEPDPGRSTLVTLTLTASGPGSVLAVRHTGFADLDPDLGDPAELAEVQVAGWENGLRRLAEVAARSAAPVG